MSILAVFVLAAVTLLDDRPGDGNWQNSWYPLGNGSLGCMLDGGTDNFRVQFNVDSLWTGGKNISSAVTDEESDPTWLTKGHYQNFGELVVFSRAIGPVSDYRRTLDLADAVYSDGFTAEGAGWQTEPAQIVREAFASRPDGLIAIRVRRSRGFPTEILLRGAHAERTACARLGADGTRATLAFSGVLPNAMGYAARVDVVADGGVSVTDDGEAVTVDAAEFTVYLRARTSLDLHRTDFGLDGTVPRIGDDGLPANFAAAKERHLADYRPLWNRMSLTLAGDPALGKLPTRERVRRCRAGKRDVALEALMFSFGRYLLIASSRPGTLPANLQGIWNASNRPEWDGDYHTNINLQMNYWAADAVNLPDCFEPLPEWIRLTLPVAVESTRAAFPQSRGFAYRTGANMICGTGWRWNYAGAPWLAAQCYDHYLFTRDRDYLRDTAWPLMKGAAEFLVSSRLKERSDGTVVVRDGWSPEHGPREDGVTHDQQIVRELFRDILSAAKELGVDDGFVREIGRLEPRLLRDRIGCWGQIQEWEADRDMKGDTHRHTSQLFAVYPGTTITRTATPELFAAARTTLEGRVLEGDARRSWVWPWRAALWARLGDGEKAGEMVASLIRYNTLDGLFCTHPPIQLDGNYGVTAAIAEMLVQSHERTDDGRTVIRLLPALPKAWSDGEATGLRVRGGATVNLKWRSGRLVSREILGGDGGFAIMGPEE